MNGLDCPRQGAAGCDPVLSRFSGSASISPPYSQAPCARESRLCRWPFGTFVASTALLTIWVELQICPVAVVLLLDADQLC